MLHRLTGGGFVYASKAGLIDRTADYALGYPYLAAEALSFNLHRFGQCNCCPKDPSPCLPNLRLKAMGLPIPFPGL